MPEGPIATVDLAAIAHNLRRVRAHVPERTQILAAVKANAYGHGAAAVARHLSELGVTWFGVATPSEALSLRAAGVSARILVFSPVYERLAELADADVAFTIAGRPSLDALVGADLPKPAKVHVKIDTGMGRLGGPASEALVLVQAADRTSDLNVEGVWTHFARSDEPDHPTTSNQIERFQSALDLLSRHGFTPPLIHAANSAACFTQPAAAFDLVRPGIALYGYHSTPALERWETELIPALTLSAPVTFAKRIAAGTPVLYGHQWKADVDTRIATVRCGYADGYPRLLSNRGRVRFGEHILPVAGRVCMDQLLVDAGNLEIGPGDQVELFGPRGPTADDLAGKIGTVSYELLTSLAPRVQRVYVNGAPAMRPTD